MATVYENPDVIFSTAASGEKCSQSKGQEKVTSSKCAKVFGTSLVFALGGLCVLGMMFMERKFEKLTSGYNSLREWLSFYEAQSSYLDGWIVSRGKVYFFSKDKLSWSNSRNVCTSKHADLVTITSKEEQDFLVSKINETHWIGLNDLDTEGHWVWVNNQTLTETGVQFWAVWIWNHEPDNWRAEDPSGENCASLGYIGGKLNTWFDASCKKQKLFICEKKYPLPFTVDN